MSFFNTTVDGKKATLWKYGKYWSNSSTCSFGIRGKTNNTTGNFLNIFFPAKLTEKLRKNTENVTKNNKNWSCSQNLNRDNSFEKTIFKVDYKLYILRWTGFLMIPLTTLYNDYFDRQNRLNKTKLM